MKLTELDKEFINEICDYSGVPDKTVMHVLQYAVIVGLLNYTESKGDFLGTIPYVGTMELTRLMKNGALVTLNKDFSKLLESIKKDNILELADFIEETQIEPRIVSACEKPMQGKPTKKETK